MVFQRVKYLIVTFYYGSLKVFNYIFKLNWVPKCSLDYNNLLIQLILRWNICSPVFIYNYDDVFYQIQYREEARLWEELDDKMLCWSSTVETRQRHINPWPLHGFLGLISALILCNIQSSEIYRPSSSYLCWILLFSCSWSRKPCPYFQCSYLWTQIPTRFINLQSLVSGILNKYVIHINFILRVLRV